MCSCARGRRRATAGPRPAASARRRDCAVQYTVQDKPISGGASAVQSAVPPRVQLDRARSRQPRRHRRAPVPSRAPTTRRVRHAQMQARPRPRAHLRSGGGIRREAPAIRLAATVGHRTRARRPAREPRARRAPPGGTGRHPARAARASHCARAGAQWRSPSIVAVGLRCARGLHWRACYDSAAATARELAGTAAALAAACPGRRVLTRAVYNTVRGCGASRRPALPRLLSPPWDDVHL